MDFVKTFILFTSLYIASETPTSSSLEMDVVDFILHPHHHHMQTSPASLAPLTGYLRYNFLRSENYNIKSLLKLSRLETLAACLMKVTMVSNIASLVGMQTGTAAVKSSMDTSQKIKKDMFFVPWIPLLGIYPKEPKTLIQKKHKHLCMFSAALFTIAKIWKQPKCPSVGEWIKQLWDIYTMEHFSTIKKNILPFATG